MENVAFSPVAVQSQDLPENKKDKIIVLEQKPDSFEPKITATGTAAAAIGAASTGTITYKASKNFIGKIIDGIEKENNSRLTEMGKPLYEIPKNFKVNFKYIGAIAAGLGAAALALKDSDKDGKLDIIEAAQKFISPEE